MAVAYATQAKPRDMSKVQCYSCKEYGHISNQCNKKFCNYCKKPGHVIADCRRCPQNRTPQALHAASSNSQPEVSSTQLTLEIVQLIHSTLSALGISGTQCFFYWLY